MALLEERVGNMAGQKEPKNIEDILKGIHGEHEENIKKFEKHMQRGNQTKLSTTVRHVFEGNKKGSITGVYESAEKQIDEEYKTGPLFEKKGDTKEYKDEKLHRIGIAIALQYFRNAKPGAIDAFEKHVKDYLKKPISQLTKKEAKELYEALTKEFDQEVGAGQIKGVQSLTDLVESVKQEFKNEDEVTADMLKEYISTYKEGHKAGALVLINTHAQAAYINHLPHGVYAGYLIEKAKARGKQIKTADALKLLGNPNVAEMAADIHVPLVQKKHDEVKYQKHGFYDKETKEMKEERKAA